MSNSSSAASELDPALWRAVAGSSVQIPSVNSSVFYFPQGHLEHSSSSSSSSSLSLNHTLTQDPMIPCSVLAVRFLSDQSSDQVFVRILLQPTIGLQHLNNDNNDGDRSDVVSFSKILTPSDANNGGGFSVPRFCAEMIFPRLDFAAEPPVQNLTMRDAHGRAWEFRHIYRGKPRRHLLTTGWSKFVNAKRLVAGDSVVFMRRNSTGELFIGVRRAAVRRGGDCCCLDETTIEKAVNGKAFEVVYYPKAGVPDFVVKAERVRSSIRMCWSEGMRVRMAVEADDCSSRVTWFQGTITAASPPMMGEPWCGSPWRMLEVNWDEPGGMQISNRVNPWQVEDVPTSSSLLDPELIPPPKKFKVLQSNEEDANGFPKALTPTMAGFPNSTTFNNSFSPGGIQGVRQEHICGINSSKFHQMGTENPNIGKGPDQSKAVSTILSIGSSYSENLSPGSQGSSVHFFGANDLLLQPGHSSPAKIGSFQLFGKIIQISEPIGGGTIGNAGCTDAMYRGTTVVDRQPKNGAGGEFWGVR